MAERLETILQNVEFWSQSKYKPNQAAIDRNKRVIKLKWKQHAKAMKEKAMSKIAGRKKNEELAKKAERLKKRK